MKLAILCHRTDAMPILKESAKGFNRFDPKGCVLLRLGLCLRQNLLILLLKWFCPELNPYCLKALHQVLPNLQSLRRNSLLNLDLNLPALLCFARKLLLTLI